MTSLAPGLGCSTWLEWSGSRVADRRCEPRGWKELPADRAAGVAGPGGIQETVNSPGCSGWSGLPVLSLDHQVQPHPFNTVLIPLLGIILVNPNMTLPKVLEVLLLYWATTQISYVLVFFSFLKSPKNTRREQCKMWFVEVLLYLSFHSTMWPENSCYYTLS